MFFLNGTTHNPEGLVLAPFSTKLLLCLMITSVLINNAVPPESNIAAIDSIDLARRGKCNMLLFRKAVKGYVRFLCGML